MPARFPWQVMLGPPHGSVVKGHSSGKLFYGLLRAPGTIVGLDDEVFTDHWSLTLETTVWNGRDVEDTSKTEVRRNKISLGR